ncbi:unnamed protein product, partial [Amoebophrya sp. A25]
GLPLIFQYIGEAVESYAEVMAQNHDAGAEGENSTPPTAALPPPPQNRGGDGNLSRNSGQDSHGSPNLRGGPGSTPYKYRNSNRDSAPGDPYSTSKHKRQHTENQLSSDEARLQVLNRDHVDGVVEGVRDGNIIRYNEGHDNHDDVDNSALYRNFDDGEMEEGFFPASSSSSSTMMRMTKKTAVQHGSPRPSTSSKFQYRPRSRRRDELSSRPGDLFPFDCRQNFGLRKAVVPSSNGLENSTQSRPEGGQGSGRCDAGHPAMSTKSRHEGHAYGSKLVVGQEQREDGVEAEGDTERAVEERKQDNYTRSRTATTADEKVNAHTTGENTATPSNLCVGSRSTTGVEHGHQQPGVSSSSSSNQLYRDHNGMCMSLKMNKSSSRGISADPSLRDPDLPLDKNISGSSSSSSRCTFSRSYLCGGLGQQETIVEQRFDGVSELQISCGDEESRYQRNGRNGNGQEVTASMCYNPSSSSHAVGTGVSYSALRGPRGGPLFYFFQGVRREDMKQSMLEQVSSRSSCGRQLNRRRRKSRHRSRKQHGPEEEREKGHLRRRKRSVRLFADELGLVTAYDFTCLSENERQFLTDFLARDLRPLPATALPERGGVDVVLHSDAVQRLFRDALAHARHEPTPTLPR